MKFGYINQKKELPVEIQQRSLSDCERIFREMPGEKNKSLDELRDQLRENDILKVQSMMVFSLAPLKLIEFIHELNLKKVRLETVAHHVDQSSFSLMFEYAKKHKGESIEMAREGIRKRGNKGGRKPGLSEKGERTAYSVAHQYTTYKNRSVAEICEKEGISRKTLYKYLRFAGVEIRPGRYSKRKTKKEK